MRVERTSKAWITPKKKKVFLEAIRTGMYRRAACILAGVNVGTFNNRMSKAQKEMDEGRYDPQCPTQTFLLEVLRVEKQAEQEWLEELKGCASDKRDWKGYQYLLERKDKHWRPAEKATEEPTGVAGELKGKTTAELEALLGEEA